MLRSDVLQAFIDRFVHARYLEIGTFEGKTFHAIRAAHKVAVDPQFRFPMPPKSSSVQYHQMTSNEYFSKVVDQTEQFDVIYLDGLHTFEQTLRDLLNAICYLSPNGIIVVDDVIPTTYYAALPNYEDFDRIWRIEGQVDGSWMGDVYRLVFFVQSFLQAFSFATVADNHGQLVLWRKQRPETSLVERSIEAFSHIAYPDVVLNRAAFRIKSVAAILQEVSSP